jgi:hypothetical protein
VPTSTGIVIECAYKHRKHMHPSDDESESELKREDRSVLHGGKEWCERCERTEVSEGRRDVVCGWQ